jgi:D,D-heptose 1,7-bisphosphate phosphatase
MQLVIIAGGKGTRLQSVLGDLPKPMAEVGGKPLIEHQILLARKHGIRDILILTGYGASYIEAYFGDGARWDVRVGYHHEAEPRGTAGALFDAYAKLQNVFVVMYGDTLVNVDLQRILAAHSMEAAATLLVHPNDHPQDSDLVELDEYGKVTAFHSYPHPPGIYFENLVNAALYVFSKEALQEPPRPGASDIAKHLFPALLSHSKRLYGYRSREYIKDAGTPRRLERVRRDYASGRVEASAFEHAMPAVFLDRDGTLNYECGWLHAPEQFELLPGAAEAVRAINEAGRLAIVITNQPVVARGECTEAGLRRIHNKLEWLLGESHAYLDAVYYCPHHPEKGFPGERTDLKIRCECRKPGDALLRTAASELHVDAIRSWMVGDRMGDIEAARRFGIRAAQVRSNQESFRDLDRGNFEQTQPDFRAEGVLEAVRHILTV